MNISTNQSRFVSQKYASIQLEGHAEGMHMLGAEREIEPQLATMGVWGQDEFNLDLSVQGPVIEDGFEGRKNYSASVFFRDLPREALPANGGLKDGMRHKTWNSTMSYEDGVLSLTQEQEIHKPGVLGFLVPKVEKNEISVEIETNPDMTEIGEVRFEETTWEKKFFGDGFKNPERVTDLDMDGFILLDQSA